MNEYEKSISEKLKTFFVQKSNILFTYWYGSRNEYTDIDIAVYKKNNQYNSDDFFDDSLASEIAHLLDKDVDVVVLNNAHLEMQYAAQKGILVFEKDREKRFEFEIMTRKKYWDFIPFLRMRMEITRKKLKALFPEVYERLENATRSK